MREPVPEVSNAGERRWRPCRAREPWAQYFGLRACRGAILKAFLAGRRWSGRPFNLVEKRGGPPSLDSAARQGWLSIDCHGV